MAKTCIFVTHIGDFHEHIGNIFNSLGCVFYNEAKRKKSSWMAIQHDMVFFFMAAEPETRLSCILCVILLQVSAVKIWGEI